MLAPETKVLLIEDNPGDAELVSILLGESKSNKFCLETRERLDAGLQRLKGGGVDVVLLDLSLPDSCGIKTFEQVRAAAPSLPVVVLSGLDDQRVAMRAVEIGAQDYLVKGGIDGNSLARAMLFAIQRHRRQPAAGKTAAIAAFVGAKGGVGTTTLALNFAVSLARRGKRVIAAELRSSFGTFAPCLCHAPASNLSSLLGQPLEQITEANVGACLVEFPFGVKVLFGPQMPKQHQPIEETKAEVVLDKMAGLADYVVLDLPDAWSPASQLGMRRATMGNVVVNSDALSVNCGRRVVDELSAAGVSRPMLHAIVVNRMGAAEGIRLEQIGDQLGCAILGVVVPAAELCMKAESAGVPFVLLRPDHLAAQIVSDMVEKLLVPEPMPTGAGAMLAR